MSQSSDTQHEQTPVQNYPKDKARQGETVLNTPTKIGIFVACAVAALAIYVIATALA